MTNDVVASTFVGRCIARPHIHTDAERLCAVQELLNAARFDAVAACWPDTDGGWSENCRGRDGPDATVWLVMLLDEMPHGIGRQREFVARALANRVGSTTDDRLAIPPICT